MLAWSWVATTSASSAASDVARPSRKTPVARSANCGWLTSNNSTSAARITSRVDNDSAGAITFIHDSTIASYSAPTSTVPVNRRNWPRLNRSSGTSSPDAARTFLGTTSETSMAEFRGRWRTSPTIARSVSSSLAPLAIRHPADEIRPICWICMTVGRSVVPATTPLRSANRRSWAACAASAFPVRSAVAFASWTSARAWSVSRIQALRSVPALRSGIASSRGAPPAAGVALVDASSPQAASETNISPIATAAPRPHDAKRRRDFRSRRTRALEGVKRSSIPEDSCTAADRGPA
jgi:hypothetical protein